MRVFRGLTILFTLSAALSCQNYGNGYGGGTIITGPPGGGGTGVAVQVGDNFYSPVAVTVQVGEIVTWTWVGANAHSVSFSSGPSSATQVSGTYQTSFPTTGTYGYSCVVHGAAMAGTVIVQ